MQNNLEDFKDQMKSNIDGLNKTSRSNIEKIDEIKQIVSDSGKQILKAKQSMANNSKKISSNNI